MLKALMRVSGVDRDLVRPAGSVRTFVGGGGCRGSGTDTPMLALVRLLGAGTFGVGVAALVGCNHLETQGGLASAYGLGVYNVLGALALMFGAATAGGAGLLGGAALHVIGLLFVYAFLARR